MYTNTNHRKKRKNMMRCHLTPLVNRMTISKTTKENKDVEKRECLCTIGGNVNRNTTMEDSMENSKKLKNKAII